MFNKGAKILEQLYMHIQKTNLNPNLILSTNIYSRSIIGQNANAKTQKYLKSTGKYLLGANKMTLRQKHKRKKIDILNCTKTKKKKKVLFRRYS